MSAGVGAKYKCPALEAMQRDRFNGFVDQPVAVVKPVRLQAAGAGPLPPPYNITNISTGSKGFCPLAPTFKPFFISLAIL